MWYVTAIAEYPIYEPAEGGYYYEGTSIVWERVFNTRRKARQFYNKARKEFIEQFGNPMTEEEFDRYYEFDNRVWDNRAHTGIYHSTRYIGQGHELTMTRKPRKERGWVPYE